MPQHWIIRAIAYNNVNDYLINSTKKPVIPHHYMTFNNDYKLVCYYYFPNEANGTDVLLAEDIDPNLCTHINAAFANIVNSSLHVEEYQLTFLKSLVDLKKVNKNLKVLVSVGGAGNDMGFPMMVVNHLNRKM